MATELFIGLMSGTSADGIDAVLVELSEDSVAVRDTLAVPHSAALRDDILALCSPADNEIDRLGALDARLGEAFAQAALKLMGQAGVGAAHIRAIGSHGQTIRHRPPGSRAASQSFSLQIGDPNVIALRTGITTVADFRRRDMALGGQGAPLVPAFHFDVFSDEQNPRCVVNIGGMANVTLLSPGYDESAVIGFDTGPGNVMMDLWAQRHLSQPFDRNGDWAASGQVLPDLLERLLQHPFFAQSPPKSTGREDFHLNWLERHLDNEPADPVDVQATLCELTAVTITRSVERYLPGAGCYVCGGGAHNHHLLDRLALHSSGDVTITSELGLHPDWVEATAFAWLARRTLAGMPGNLPSVTGASRATVLGGIYTP